MRASRVAVVLLMLFSFCLTALVACGQPAVEEAPPPTAVVEQPAPTEPAVVEAPPPTEQPTVEAPPKPTEAVIIQGSEVTTLDPNMDTFIHHLRIYGNLFDFLLMRDDNMVLGPALATSWKIVDDTTWEFDLRTDVKFHDGTPFTPEDVKFTIERILDPALASKQIILVDNVQEVQVVDNDTVRIITKTPYPLMAERLTAMPIVSKTIVEKMGAAVFAESPVGSGPYKFESWTRGGDIVLVRNDDYWGGAPPIEKLIFKSIAEPSTRMAALQTGEADVVDGVPADSVAEIEANSELDVRAVPSIRVMHMQIDTTVEPFTDARVRQALNYAVDVDSIVENVLGGHGYRVNNVIGPTYFGYDPNIAPYKEDLEKAKSLLAEAGYPDGFSTEMVVGAGRFFMDKEVTEALSGQLARVGIDAQVKTIEYATLLSQITAGEHPPIYFFSWAGGFDADETLYSIAGCEQVYSNYCNEELQPLLEEARNTMDKDKRLELYLQADKIIAEEAPFIFLYQQEGLFGVDANLNWQPRSDEMIWFHRASFGD